MKPGGPSGAWRRSEPAPENEVGIMFRKDLIELLLNNPMSAAQIARTVDERPAQISDDLEHLFRSLKHTDYKAVVEPARCRICGFEFSEAKLSKPSKCPKCRSTWLTDPKVRIETRA